jgi:ADP-heptose:LPS heptosyltransferase
MYTGRVARPRQLRPRHSVENQWDLLAALDESFRTPPDPRRDAVTMAEDEAAVDRVLRRAPAVISGEGPVIVVHVSAGNPFRRWPSRSFVDLVVALAEADHRRRIVLTSGPSDLGAAREVGDRARERLGPLGSAVAHGGEFDLAELRALVDRSALFVGGDSGPLHVAATTRTSIVGIFGPTLPVRSAPWRDPDLVTESVELAGLGCRPCNQRRCAPGDFRCLTALDAGLVVDASERALARDARQRSERG